MISNLERKIKFIELLDEMKNIERTIRLKNGREENDAEHSYHLAMMVLVLIEDFPELNILKSLKMALTHDLVEIFAGDTYFIDKDKLKTKKSREEEAIKKLELTLGEKSFSVIKDSIIEYEKKDTRESKFVYQIDKLQPIIQVIMEGGSSFHEYKADKNKVIENKLSKIDDTFGFREILKKYFDRAEKEGIYYEEK